MPAEASATRVRLAIAIPAYGRAEATAASVAGMAAEAREGGLPITFYVSDDTPDASVEDALAPLAAAGLPIHYHRNTPSLGHDRNLIATLLWPEADYVWLMGNSYRAGAGKLQVVLDFLQGQDFVFMDAHAPHQPQVAVVEGKEATALLREVLWHQVLTGATIYGARVRDWVRTQGDALVVVRNFPQICMMLGFASAQAMTIGWLAGGRTLQPAGITDTSYWRNHALEVFGIDWSDAIDAFPAVVPPGEATRVIRLHSARTDLFNTRYLTTLKADGQFRWASLRQPGVRRAMHLPMWKLLAVLALPVPVLRGGGETLAGLKRLSSRG